MCRVASAGDLKAEYYPTYIWVAWGFKRGALFRVAGQLVLSCAPDLVVRSFDGTLCGRPVSIATPSRRLRRPPANHHSLPSRSSLPEVCPPLLSLHHSSPPLACHSQACARKVARQPIHDRYGFATKPTSHACTGHSATSLRRPPLTVVLSVRSCVELKLARCPQQYGVDLASGRSSAVAIKPGQAQLLSICSPTVSVRSELVLAYPCWYEKHRPHA